MLKNALGLFIFSIVVLVVFLPSYTRMQDLKQKNSDYKKQIEQLTKKNAELKEEKRRLEQDPIYLEKVAREKMGLVKDGEVVYKIMPATPVVQNKPVAPKTQTVLKKNPVKK